MKTFKGYQRHLAEEIANSAIHDKLVATGVVGKHSKRTEPRVFNPGDKLSNADFSNLIKSTFDGVDKVNLWISSIIWADSCLLNVFFKIYKSPL